MTIIDPIWFCLEEFQTSILGHTSSFGFSDFCIRIVPLFYGYPGYQYQNVCDSLIKSIIELSKA